MIRITVRFRKRKEVLVDRALSTWGTNKDPDYIEAKEDFKEEVELSESDCCKSCYENNGWGCWYLNNKDDKEKDYTIPTKGTQSTKGTKSTQKTKSTGKTKT